MRRDTAALHSKSYRLTKQMVINRWWIAPLLDRLSCWLAAPPGSRQQVPRARPEILVHRHRRTVPPTPRCPCCKSEHCCVHVELTIYKGLLGRIALFIKPSQ